MSKSTANTGSASLPITAPSSQPGPPTYRDMSLAGEDLVLPTSPQQQQRLRIASGSTSADSSNHASYIGDDDDNDNRTDVRASCTISAVTTPRAAWAQEGDSILDDVLGGSSRAHDHSSSAAGSRGFPDAAKLRLGENGFANGLPMMFTTADMTGHDTARCPDELGESKRLDTSVAQQPRSAAFGKPSTKVRGSFRGECTSELLHDDGCSPRRRLIDQVKR